MRLSNEGPFPTEFQVVALLVLAPLVVVTSPIWGAWIVVHNVVRGVKERRAARAAAERTSQEDKR